MRRMIFAAAAIWLTAAPALAWGPEGHSIVAEIAQRRLSPPAAATVDRLLKGGSLASIASWGDVMRVQRPTTNKWHFVDIPLTGTTYDPQRDCKPDAKKGDCVINELDRLRNELRCGKDDTTKREALKFAVHFLGDIHQPLHTVLEEGGGNGVPVDIFMRGIKDCTGKCEPQHEPSNFHKAWDEDLINKVVWDWGGYVDRLEAGWLKSDEAKREAADRTPIAHDTLVDWAQATHREAIKVWNLRPADNVLNDQYLNTVLPVMDRQLGLGGVRLARFLNQAYGSRRCRNR